MIHFILILNRQGKTRLAKYYSAFSDAEKSLFKTQVHKLVAQREVKYFANYVEFKSYKIVYRRYAGLYFCFAVNLNDNELFYLEAIHLLVEVLDRFFKNVCELDLVFNFYKVYAILDELFVGGEMLEMSKDVIMERLERLEKMD